MFTLIEVAMFIVKRTRVGSKDRAIAGTPQKGASRLLSDLPSNGLRSIKVITISIEAQLREIVAIKGLAIIVNRTVDVEVEGGVDKCNPFLNSFRGFEVTQENRYYGEFNIARE